MNRSSVMQAVMQQTVRSFWQNINWDNRPLMNPPVTDGVVTTGTQLPTSLSFAMTVKDYFVAVSWEGTPEIGVIPNGGDGKHRHNEPELGNDATLDDFLEDLSKFF
jgi:hypothetical protein